MPMTIEWSMRLFDNDQELVARHKEEDVSNFYNGAPELFVKDRAEVFFGIEKWNEHFGLLSEEDGDVIVEIYGPEDHRGKWRIHLELKVEATSAEKMEETPS